MGPLKVTYKVHSSRLSFSSEKTKSKFNIKSKEIVSKVKSSKFLSKIKTLMEREKVVFGPMTWMENWMDNWKDNTPVISASKEFYGLPQDVIELLWTYIIESDEKTQNYVLKPSLMESVYHYEDCTDILEFGFKVRMTGARTLLRIDSFSRSLALKKFRGTLPIFYVPFKDHGILRFDPKRDIIQIRDFHHLAFQMTPTVGMGLMLDLEYHYLADDTALELLKFHPKFRHVRRRMRMEHIANGIYASLSMYKYCKASVKSRQLARLLSILKNRYELPCSTWDQSTSIQNLVIDHDLSMDRCALIICKSMALVNAKTVGAVRMPEFTAGFGPVSKLFKSLREVGNVENLRFRIHGGLSHKLSDDWHKLSDDKFFNKMLEEEPDLIEYALEDLDDFTSGVYIG
ncbi:uncharacterized protein EAE98_002404 [Botrytis deweyae]|uniref:Uncharacterized protein n=1 Tax=Botrytis deweyae TaxID=2478750 RepID=A0ABQ7IX19_9HELO|nr:uncharacterized protein EAE98_002404 [Botrytis deweyae]KAF7936185.1 hypothetical protein EAE98_002404 [Botrytis deweyae]